MSQKKQWLYLIILNVIVSSMTTILLHFCFNQSAAPSVSHKALVEPVWPELFAASAPLSGPACLSDQQKFCRDKFGSQAIDACLQDHFDEVSAPCRESLEIAREQLAPCRNEISRFCPSTNYGGGRILRCLSPHRSELSKECHAALFRELR